MWTEHFKNMAKGNIPFQKKMYINLQKGAGPIQVVSPTEAVVQQARTDLKRTLEEADTYNPKKAKLLFQSGGGAKRRRKKTRKRQPLRKKKRKLKR